MFNREKIRKPSLQEEKQANIIGKGKVNPIQMQPRVATCSKAGQYAAKQRNQHGMECM